MPKSLFIAAVFQLITHSAFSTTEISIPAFCDKFLGSYKISAANGVKPKMEAELASVEKDLSAQECILTFPYCIPNNSSCDPGYLFMGFSNTKVFEENTGAYTLLSEQNGKTYRYTWSFQNENLRFVNYQYLMPNGDALTLEHVATRSNDD